MNEAGRFNKIVLIIGARGTGKTTYVFGDEKAGIPPKLLELYLKKLGMKILVVCCEDSPVYRHIDIIDKKDIKRFKNGLGRVVINPEDINTFCRYVTDNQIDYNTLIIFDDARNHSETKLCKEMNRLLANTKQHNCDVMFMYHGFGETPQDIYRKIDYIVLLKTLDSPEVRKMNLKSCFARTMQAYDILQASANRFDRRTISTIDEIRA